MCKNEKERRITRPISIGFITHNHPAVLSQDCEAYLILLSAEKLCGRVAKDAQEYATLKMRLATANSKGMAEYLEGKQNYIERITTRL